MDDRTAALMRQAWPRQLTFLVFMAALLFAPGGTIAFWQGWLFLAILVGCTIPLGIYFVIHDPALVERRMKAGPVAEQEPAQKIAIGIVFAALLAMLAVPGFDRRWHWSDVPAWLTILSECVIAATFVIFWYVMKQNSFAAATVRVEREQTVISTGLYGVVHHPMYMGTLPLAIAIPLALGSWWALLPALALVPALVWRLLDEERLLRRALAGYAAYCQSVRYRLVPGLW